MTKAEDELEEARRRVHKRGASAADMKRYKAAQDKVAKERQEARKDRPGLSVVATDGKVG